MTTVFARWDEARAAADTADAKRALLGELAQWRALNLMDVVGQRDATWAVAKVQQALGAKDAALGEARSLVSLCRTPPAASDAALDAAEALVAELGGEPPSRKRKKKERKEREPRADRGRREPREIAPKLGPLEQAVSHGHAGAYADAFKALRGKGGPRAQLIRAWLDLKQAIEGPADGRDAALQTLLRRIEGGLPAVPEGRAKAAAPAPDAAPPESRLGRLIGRRIPDRRAKALRAVQAFLDRNPGQADAAAAAALLDHLDTAGTAPAPWLASLVAQAVVDSGEQTAEAMKRLREAGSVALAIYDEAPFAALVDVWREARAAGLGFVDLRRGVLRKEPEDRRLWTLRLHRDGNEGVITLAPNAEAPLDDALATELAKRVRGLCEVMVLVAPGPGNAALRAGVGVLGVDVVELPEALGRVRSQLGNKPAAERRPAPAAEPVAAPPKARPPSHLDRVAAVKEALFAEQAPTAETLEPLVAPIKRVRDVLDVAEGLSGEDAPDRLIALILAIHRTVPERVRLLQATTLVLRTAARTGRSDLLELLTQGETAARFGGPGVDAVVQASTALHSAGWRLDRVLRGVTRRERRELPALDVLSDHLEPLWRLLVQRGEVRGEIWVADALPPEGLAGLPQLCLRDAHRVAVIGEGLQASWVELGGPPAVTAEALAPALDAWPH